MDTVSLVAALIDESGSMSDVVGETISGYNAFVESVQREQAGKGGFVSTFLFDRAAYTTGLEPVMRVLQAGAPLADAIPLSRLNYNPRGFTPLYDAVALAVASIRKSVQALGVNRVTFLIQTDGHENASREVSHAAVKALVEGVIAEGWQVIFLGADLSDAKNIGVGIGVSASNSMGYSKAATAQTFDTMALRSRGYRVSASAAADLNLSAEEKAKMGSSG